MRTTRMLLAGEYAPPAYGYRRGEAVFPGKMLDETQACCARNGAARFAILKGRRAWSYGRRMAGGFSVGVVLFA